MAGALGSFNGMDYDATDIGGGFCEMLVSPGPPGAHARTDLRWPRHCRGYRPLGLDRRKSSRPLSAWRILGLFCLIRVPLIPVSVRNHILTDVIGRLDRRDVPIHEQVAKYVAAGVMALSVDVLVFYSIAMTVLPALAPNDAGLRLIVGGLKSLGLDPSVGATEQQGAPSMSHAVRGWHFAVARLVAFLCANYVAYALNRRFVFVSGRHRMPLEAVLFYLAAGSASGLSVLVGWALIRLYGTGTSEVFVLTVLVSLTVNFVARKKVVFLG